MATFDTAWNRNFLFSTKAEREKDSPIDDKVKITWENAAFMKKRSVSTLIVACNESNYLMNAIFNKTFQKLATINLSEFGMHTALKSQFVESKFDTKVEIFMNNDGISRILEENGVSEPKKEIIFIKCKKIDLRYSYCINEFSIQQFAPDQIICLDTLARGKYVQNTCDLSNQLPLLRKIHNSYFIKYITLLEQQANQLLSKSSTSTSNLSQEENEMIETARKEIATENEIAYLETGNLVTSLASAMLEKCQVKKQSCSLYVCVTDLDFLGETLSSLANVVVGKCPTLAASLTKQFEVEKNEKNEQKGIKSGTVQQYIHKKCCRFASQSGHLSPGLGIFM